MIAFDTGIFSIWIVLVNAPYFRLVGLGVLIGIFFLSLVGYFPLAEVDALVSFSDEISTAPPPPLSIPAADILFDSSLITSIQKIYHLHHPLLPFLLNIYHFHTTLLPFLMKDLSFTLHNYSVPDKYVSFMSSGYKWLEEGESVFCKVAPHFEINCNRWHISLSFLELLALQINFTHSSAISAGVTHKSSTQPACMIHWEFQTIRAYRILNRILVAVIALHIVELMKSAVNFAFRTHYCTTYLEFVVWWHWFTLMEDRIWRNSLVTFSCR